MPNPVFDEQELDGDDDRTYMPLVVQLDTEHFGRYSYWITKDDLGDFHVRCYRESPSDIGTFHFSNRQWSVAALSDLADTLFHATQAIFNNQFSRRPLDHSLILRFCFGVEGPMSSSEFFQDVSDISPEDYMDRLNDMAPLLGRIMYSREPVLHPPPPPLRRT